MVKYTRPTWNWTGEIHSRLTQKLITQWGGHNTPFQVTKGLQEQSEQAGAVKRQVLVSRSYIVTSVPKRGCGWFLWIILPLAGNWNQDSGFSRIVPSPFDKKNNWLGDLIHRNRVEVAGWFLQLGHWRPSKFHQMSWQHIGSIHSIRFYFQTLWHKTTLMLFFVRNKYLL